MTLYERWLRAAAFRLDPETAHELALGLLSVAGRTAPLRALISRLYGFEHPSLKTTVAGLDFPNPVGLAAGFDKDCRAVPALCAAGFGFLEVGTITLRAQDGNPRPRLFRFPSCEGLVNRMGFNNEGSEAAAARLSRLKKPLVPVGVNLGLNADVPAEKAPAEYALAFSRLYPYGDYFTLNVSCPNQLGLRRLQEKLRLERILLALKQLNRSAKPVFVKLSPDIEPAELEGLIPLIMDQASGVVCSNTTLSRDEAALGAGGYWGGSYCASLPEEIVTTRGGLSGAPLRSLSTKMIREVYRLSAGKLPIIAGGGVFSAEDAYEKIRAGASLVQVYTGLVYRGFGLVPEIKQGLARLLIDHNLSRIGEAVGRSHVTVAQA